ncbi:3980_t:CDS:2 [Rhizophagus irregularis]|nr:3980_t:CDS:2 [Rhizophagus irregularis]
MLLSNRSETRGSDGAPITAVLRLGDALTAAVALKRRLLLSN